MGADRIVGLRIQRHAPVILAWYSGRDVAENELALADVRGSATLALIAIVPQRIAFAATDAVIGRVLAVGADAPDVAAALRGRDVATRETAERVCGPSIVVSDVRWSDDCGRLTVVLGGEPSPLPEDLRDRLARAFMTEIRIAWADGA